MTLESYKSRAAEFREHMEQPMPPADLGSVTATRVSAYLPGGEKRSMVTEKPPTVAEDLSHLNSPSWRKLKAAGKKNGRRPNK